MWSLTELVKLLNQKRAAQSLFFDQCPYGELFRTPR